MLTLSSSSIKCSSIQSKFRRSPGGDRITNLREQSCDASSKVGPQDATQNLNLPLQPTETEALRIPLKNRHRSSRLRHNKHAKPHPVEVAHAEREAVLGACSTCLSAPVLPVLTTGPLAHCLRPRQRLRSLYPVTYRVTPEIKT